MPRRRAALRARLAGGLLLLAPVAACGPEPGPPTAASGDPALVVPSTPWPGQGSWIAGRALHLERPLVPPGGAGTPGATTATVGLPAPFLPSESGSFDAAQASADLALVGYLGWEPGDPSATPGYDGPLPADDDPVGRSILHLVTDTGEVVESIDGVTSFAISAGGAVAIARKEDPWSYTGDTQPSSLSVRRRSGETVAVESSGDASAAFWLGDVLLYAHAPGGVGGEGDESPFELRAYDLRTGERIAVGDDLVAYLPVNDHQALVQPRGGGLSDLAVWDARARTLVEVAAAGASGLEPTGLRANLGDGRVAVHHLDADADGDRIAVFAVERGGLRLQRVVRLDPEAVVAVDAFGAGAGGALVGWGLAPGPGPVGYVSFTCDAGSGACTYAPHDDVAPTPLTLVAPAG